MKMIFEWVIKHIGNTELIWSSVNYRTQKITIVIEEITKRIHKRSIAVDLLKEAVWRIYHYKIWDIIRVHIETKATYKEKRDRFFNTVRSTKIERLYKVPDEEIYEQEEDEPF